MKGLKNLHIYIYIYTYSIEPFLKFTNDPPANFRELSCPPANIGWKTLPKASLPHRVRGLGYPNVAGRIFFHRSARFKSEMVFHNCLLLMATRNPVKSLTSWGWLVVFSRYLLWGFKNHPRSIGSMGKLSFRSASHPGILGGFGAGNTAAKMVGSVQLASICSLPNLYKYPHMAKMFPNFFTQFPAQIWASGQLAIWRTALSHKKKVASLTEFKAEFRHTILKPRNHCGSWVDMMLRNAGKGLPRVLNLVYQWKLHNTMVYICIKTNR